jgi:oligoendopeptidase F
MIATAIRYGDELGASPEQLGITLDLKPRRGKDPVAFTDFVRHGRYENGAWRGGAFRVSASYRAGGLGNLYELMHEMGHGAHIAAIRARPAYCDWPDSDVLTEALADVFGVEAYEPAWERRYIGAAATPLEATRARLSGTMLDVAWALFEMRAHRDPAIDPSVLWAEITSRYLGIAAHPDLPWWALRGQLIDAPGYMTNYALGAIVTEALRARVRILLGADAFEAPSPELYGWLSDRLYRYGLERSSREVVQDFLGGPLAPGPFLSLISRGRGGP